MSRQWDLQDHDLDQDKIRQRTILLESKDYSFVTEQLKYRFTDSILPQMYDTTLNRQTDSS